MGVHAAMVHIEDGSLTLTAKHAKPFVLWQNDGTHAPDISA